MAATASEIDEFTSLAEWELADAGFSQQDIEFLVERHGVSRSGGGAAGHAPTSAAAALKQRKHSELQAEMTRRLKAALEQHTSLSCPKLSQMMSGTGVSEWHDAQTDNMIARVYNGNCVDGGLVPNSAVFSQFYDTLFTYLKPIVQAQLVDVHDNTTNSERRVSEHSRDLLDQYKPDEFLSLPTCNIGPSAVNAVAQWALLFAPRLKSIVMPRNNLGDEGTINLAKLILAYASGWGSVLEQFARAEHLGDMLQVEEFPFQHRPNSPAAARNVGLSDDAKNRAPEVLVARAVLRQIQEVFSDSFNALAFAQQEQDRSTSRKASGRLAAKFTYLSERYLRVWPSCDELDPDVELDVLSKFGISPDTVATHSLSSIAHLDLRSNDISPEGIVVLVAALMHTPSLTSLDLSSDRGFKANTLGVEGARALGRLLQRGSTLAEEEPTVNGTHNDPSLSKPPQLSELRLGAVGHLGLNELANNGLRGNTTLKLLDLRNNHIPDRCMQTLCKAISESSIERVNLSRNSFQNTGGQAICNMIAKSQALRYLDISHTNNSCNAAFMKQLSAALSTSGILLSTLIMDNNDLSTSIQALDLRVRQNVSLSSLSLANCSLVDTLGDGMYQWLAHSTTLQSLDLKGNFLADEGTARFFDSLIANEQHSALRNINISKNGIKTTGGDAIIRFLLSAHPVVMLDVSENMLPKAVGVRLLSTLTRGPRLCHQLDLRLSGNMFGSKLDRKLRIVLKQHNKAGYAASMKSVKDEMKLLPKKIEEVRLATQKAQDMAPNALVEAQELRVQAAAARDELARMIGDEENALVASTNELKRTLALARVEEDNLTLHMQETNQAIRQRQAELVEQSRHFKQLAQQERLRALGLQHEVDQAKQRLEDEQNFLRELDTQLRTERVLTSNYRQQAHAKSEELRELKDSVRREYYHALIVFMDSQVYPRALQGARPGGKTFLLQDDEMMRARDIKTKRARRRRASRRASRRHKRKAMSLPQHAHDLTDWLGGTADPNHPDRISDLGGEKWPDVWRHELLLLVPLVAWKRHISHKSLQRSTVLQSSAAHIVQHRQDPDDASAVHRTTVVVGAELIRRASTANASSSHAQNGQMADEVAQDASVELVFPEPVLNNVLRDLGYDRDVFVAWMHSHDEPQEDSTEVADELASPMAARVSSTDGSALPMAKPFHVEVRLWGHTVSGIPSLAHRQHTMRSLQQALVNSHCVSIFAGDEKHRKTLSKYLEDVSVLRLYAKLRGPVLVQLLQQQPQLFKQRLVFSVPSLHTVGQLGDLIANFIHIDPAGIGDILYLSYDFREEPQAMFPSVTNTDTDATAGSPGSPGKLRSISSGDIRELVVVTVPGKGAKTVDSVLPAEPVNATNGIAEEQSTVAQSSKLRDPKSRQRRRTSSRKHARVSAARQRLLAPRTRTPDRSMFDGTYWSNAFSTLPIAVVLDLPEARPKVPTLPIVDPLQDSRGQLADPSAEPSRPMAQQARHSQSARGHPQSLRRQHGDVHAYTARDRATSSQLPQGGTAVEVRPMSAAKRRFRVEVGKDVPDRHLEWSQGIQMLMADRLGGAAEPHELVPAPETAAALSAVHHPQPPRDPKTLAGASQRLRGGRTARLLRSSVFRSDQQEPQPAPGYDQLSASLLTRSYTQPLVGLHTLRQTHEKPRVPLVKTTLAANTRKSTSAPDLQCMVENDMPEEYTVATGSSLLDVELGMDDSGQVVVYTATQLGPDSQQFGLLAPTPPARGPPPSTLCKDLARSDSEYFMIEALQEVGAGQPTVPSFRSPRRMPSSLARIAKSVKRTQAHAYIERDTVNVTMTNPMSKKNERKKGKQKKTGGKLYRGLGYHNHKRQIKSLAASNPALKRQQRSMLQRDRMERHALKWAARKRKKDLQRALKRQEAAEPRAVKPRWSRVALAQPGTSVQEDDTRAPWLARDTFVSTADQSGGMSTYVRRSFSSSTVAAANMPIHQHDVQ